MKRCKIDAHFERRVVLDSNRSALPVISRHKADVHRDDSERRIEPEHQEFFGKEHLLIMKNIEYAVKRFFALLLAVAMLFTVLLLASCSSGDAGGTESVPQAYNSSTICVTMPEPGSTTRYTELPAPSVTTTRTTLPDDFSFSITWGIYGESSYDSRSGELVKTKNATTPSDYITKLILTENQKLTIYKLLTEDIDLSLYPAYYDPFNAPNTDIFIASDPSQTIRLSFTANGQTRSVGCVNIAVAGMEECYEKKGEDLLKVALSISELLMDTEEWKALPEYEFFYD